MGERERERQTERANAFLMCSKDMTMVTMSDLLKNMKSIFFKFAILLYFLYVRYVMC